MGNILSDFTESKKKLFGYFKCSGDYFVKNLEHVRWDLSEEEGIYFLSYWNNESDKVSAVVIKKNDEPLIYRTKEHTMVIAIDCVKTAFIFSNWLKKP